MRNSDVEAASLQDHYDLSVALLRPTSCALITLSSIFGATPLTTTQEAPPSMDSVATATNSASYI